jgi:hypothetical protein
MRSHPEAKAELLVLEQDLQMVSKPLLRVVEQMANRVEHYYRGVWEDLALLQGVY